MPSGTIYVLLADINVSVVPCEVNNEKVRPCPHYGVNLAFLEVGLLSYLHLFGKIYYHIPQYQEMDNTHPALLYWQEKESDRACISVPIILFKLLLRISLFLMVLNIIRTWVSKGVESGKRVYQLLLPLAGRTPPFLTSWVVDSGRPCARVGFQVGSLCRPVNGSLRHNVHCTTTQQTYLDT